MTQDELYEMWAQDGHINLDQLQHEAIKTPNLHAKYLRLYGFEKRKLKFMAMELDVLKYEMDDFVNMGHGEGLQRGWTTPPGGHIKEKSKRERYVTVESHVITKQLEVSEQEIIVEALLAIIKEITQRTWHIGRVIDHMKFLNP